VALSLLIVQKFNQMHYQTVALFYAYCVHRANFSWPYTL